MYVFQFYRSNITRALISNTFCRKMLKIYSKSQKIIWHIVLKKFKFKFIIRNSLKNPV